MFDLYSFTSLWSLVDYLDRDNPLLGVDNLYCNDCIRLVISDIRDLS